MLGIILGPQTRLAKSLLSLEWPNKHQWILIGRNPSEIGSLTDKYPNASIFPAWEKNMSLKGGVDPVLLFCCALGPIHRTSPKPAADSEILLRDLDIIKNFMNACGSLKMHIIFVSTAVVFLITRKRMYYAGWRCIAETGLEALVERRSNILLSVLYPGRLVESPSLKYPESLLYTRYEKLAKLMKMTALSDNPRRSIVGLDARLLLMIQGMKQLFPRYLIKEYQ